MVDASSALHVVHMNHGGRSMLWAVHSVELVSQLTNILSLLSDCGRLRGHNPKIQAAVVCVCAGLTGLTGLVLGQSWSI